MENGEILDGKTSEKPSTTASEEDLKLGVVDSYGVVYSKDGKRLLKGNSDLSTYTIKDGTQVICDDAFNCCRGLTSIEIPSSVTEIGFCAFNCCSGLTSLEIPSSVTEIICYAFSGCSGLTSLEIPSTLKSIGNFAFSSCSGLNSIKVSPDNEVYDSREDCNAIIETSSNTLILGCKNAIIPTSVTSIGMSAFYGCSGLTSLEIPSSVIEIEDLAFMYCSGLSSIKVSPDNEVYDSREDCNAIIDTIFDKLILGCKNTIIPSTVTEISFGAFHCCSGLTSIEIPSSVTEIGLHAFSGCSGLTSIKVSPKNLVFDSREDCNAIIATLYDTLIFGCKNTKIPCTVEIIEDYSFSGCCKEEDIEIPPTVIEIGDFAFKWPI